VVGTNITSRGRVGAENTRPEMTDKVIGVRKMTDKLYIRISEFAN